MKYIRGFTLVELMVSVAIFSIVMVMALGALLSLTAADRKAETLSAVMNNLNFAVESMSRNVRAGYNYHCGSLAGMDCVSGNNYFAFTSANNQIIIYRFDNTSLCGQTSTTRGCIVRSTDGGSTFAPITAPEVLITSLTFYLRGSTQSDPTQPLVTMILNGYVQVTPTTRSQFNLQTSMAQRIFDI